MMSILVQIKSQNSEVRRLSHFLKSRTKITFPIEISLCGHLLVVLYISLHHRIAKSFARSTFATAIALLRFIVPQPVHIQERAVALDPETVHVAQIHHLIVDHIVGLTVGHMVGHIADHIPLLIYLHQL